MIIYKTEKWKEDEHNCYWYEYRRESDDIIKYLCHRSSYFEGNKNDWGEDEHIIESWCIGETEIPDWLFLYI